MPDKITIDAVMVIATVAAVRGAIRTGDGNFQDVSVLIGSYPPRKITPDRVKRFPCHI